ncbi:MAG: multicopper oxidase domain-containing protein [Thermoanaerobaculia bacterium]
MTHQQAFTSSRALRGALLTCLVASFAGAAGAATVPQFQIDGRTYGMPEAQIFEDPYIGPPVVGEFVTLLPNLAVLPHGNRTHKVRFDIIAREIEIAPDVRYRAWTFGGTVPGPVLHVREGDRVEFTMKNRSAEVVTITAPEVAGSPYLEQLAALDPQKAAPLAQPMRHSIDFHAGTVAASDKWRGIEPGQAIRFEWIANYPGVYLYHCGTPPILMHMSQGQYGVVVVSPKEGYPTDGDIDREYVIVQSEFYLKEAEAQTHEGDQTEFKEVERVLYEIDYEAAMRKQPLVVAFNGHQRSLIDHPLAALPGERVRLYVLNAGPTDTSSFHVVGVIFDKVWYEGNPHNEWRGMQTVLLGASNGAAMEFIVPEEGDYVIVDHEFADAQKGALGRIRAGHPGPGAQDGH